MANVDQPDNVWINDGTGFFRRGQLTTESLTSCRVEVADLNGDHSEDLFVINGFRGTAQPGQILLSTAEPETISLLHTPLVTGGDIALADFNGDDTMDIFVATRPNAPNRLWFSNPKSSGEHTDTKLALSEWAVPEPAVNPFAGSVDALDDNGSAFAVAGGDFDGDGDVDALVANHGRNVPSQVWLNDGSGQFDAGEFLDVPDSSDVAVGDFDSDGDLDAVFSSQGSRAVIWRNDGRAHFELVSETEPLDAKCVAIGDLDGDGDLDFVVGCQHESPANRVFFNDGQGHFTNSGQQLGASDTLGIELADVDDDGDLDVFAANWNDGNVIWLNDGTGQFIDSDQRLGSSNYVHAALSDIDGDGDVDACATSPRDPTTLWLNDGHGRFSQAPLSDLKTPGVGIAIADLNGDGLGDVLIGNGDLGDGHSMFPNQILISRGPLLWESFWLGTQATADFVIADFDGDLDPDVFLANGFGKPDCVWRNRTSDEEEQRSGLFFQDSGQRLGSSTSNDVALGDVDGDGDLDAVVANFKGDTNNVWLNDGTGQFKPGMSLTEPLHAHSVRLGDLDAFLPSKEGPNRIWLNDGNGQFKLNDQQLGDSSSNQVALADFDGDGDLDVWIGNFNPHHDRVWLNDGDGEIDVLTSSGANHVNSLWLNDGEGRFTRSEQDLNGSRASNGFTVGDLNGDGFPDLYECGWYDADSVWLNDGQGRFVHTGKACQRLRSRRAALVDLDGDGDLDVVVANQVGFPNAVCLNNGEGEFSDPVEYLGSNATSSLALGDLDSDGDIDVFTTNARGQENQVWLNNSQPTLSR